MGLWARALTHCKVITFDYCTAKYCHSVISKILILWLTVSFVRTQVFAAVQSKSISARYGAKRSSSLGCLLRISWYCFTLTRPWLSGECCQSTWWYSTVSCHWRLSIVESLIWSCISFWLLCVCVQTYGRAARQLRMRLVVDYSWRPLGSAEQGRQSTSWSVPRQTVSLCSSTRAQCKITTVNSNAK